ncbi:hypothetical protein [Qipengyuania aquimaris]|uniref:hypothetical protein n=1 Tax=Qipengyuania aquimaris TaxID=255984 RepID=UPI001FD2A646|nr:hypothetical protein [Qipengyuania aquimaris]UOR14687.1 hypothetical protein LCM05_09320 [Qipengyuania aquimaris]
MRRFLIVLGAAILSACSPPVMFAVDVDEEIDGGTLVLNGESAALMQNMDGSYWARWDGSDASGFIELIYPDGKTARCEVGYVTQGMLDVQSFEVRERACAQVRY